MHSRVPPLLLAVGLIVLLVALAIVALPHAAPALVAWQFGRLGLEGRVEQVEIGIERTVVRGLQVGDGQTIEHLRIDYRPLDLMRGRIAALSAEGVSLRARLGEDGLELLGLPPPGGAGGGLAVPLPERIVLQDVSLLLETGATALRLVGDLSADLEGTMAAFELALTSLEGGDLAGGIAAEGRLAGTVDLAADDPLASLEAAGDLAFEVADLVLPDAAATANAAGRLELRARDRQVRLTTGESALILDDAQALGMGAYGVELPARLALGRDDDPFEIAVRAAGPGFDLELGGPLAFEGGAATAQGVVQAELELGGEGAPRLRSASTQLRASGLRLDQLDLRTVTLEVSARRTAEALAADGRLEALAAGPLPGGVGADPLRIVLPFAAVLDDGRATVSLAGPGAIEIEGLRQPEILASGRLELQMTPEDQPLLQVNLATRAWQVDLPTAVQAVRLEPAAGLPVTRLAAERGRIRVAARGQAGELERGRVIVEDAVVTSADPQLRLEGVSLRLPFGPGGLIPGSTAPFAVQMIRPAGNLAPVPPLRLSGQVRPKQQDVAFQATVRDVGERATLRVDGRHDPLRNRGTATIALTPLVFAPDGLQPADLVPALGDQLQQVAGRIDLDGALAWTPDGLTSDLRLLLDRLAFTAGPARVEGLAGVVAIDGLTPPSTPPDQRLAIGLVDLGLTFVNGRATFRLEPGGPLVVDALRFEWAGGELQAEPFTIGSGVASLSSVLEARGLGLNAILKEVRLPGLSGKGTIDGALPVRIEGDEAVIEAGELRARDPGWIRYRPEDTPEAFAAGGESMGLLLQALENFRYDELRLTLDGRTDAAMDIGLHLKGANPDLYDGHPIEFNLDLEGELANILRSGLRSYTLPDRVRERIEGFGDR